MTRISANDIVDPLTDAVAALSVSDDQLGKLKVAKHPAGADMTAQFQTISTTARVSDRVVLSFIPRLQYLTDQGILTGSTIWTLPHLELLVDAGWFGWGSIQVSMITGTGFLLCSYARVKLLISTPGLSPKHR